MFKTESQKKRRTDESTKVLSLLKKQKLLLLPYSISIFVLKLHPALNSFLFLYQIFVRGWKRRRRRNRRKKSERSKIAHGQRNPIALLGVISRGIVVNGEGRLAKYRGEYPDVLKL